MLFQGLWHLICVLEVMLSTAIHMTYAACIVFYALLMDSFKLLKTFRGSSAHAEASPLMRAEAKAAAAPQSSFSSDVPPAVAELNGHKIGTKGKNGYATGYHLAPIILVHGIFGFGHGKLGDLSYFGGAELKDERVLVPDLGSLTSLHDRACELFYYLKGGMVDYGKEHSHQFGHDRFGRTYKTGHYPEWDEHHPVHFVGHSSGVQVARLLQTLLAEKYFPGFEHTNEDWVASITSLSGALNGTTRVYMDGLSPDDGRTMLSIALLQVLRIGVIAMEWLDFAPLTKFYSWGFEHFGMSWRRVGLKGLIDSFRGRLGPFQSGDWILPDLSIQATIELNRRLKTYPSTYYFSYATVKTRRVMGRTVPATAGIHPLFFLRSLQMSQWRHPSHLAPPYKGYRDEDWHDNDGALNTISMLYPRLPEEHPHLPLKLELKERQRFKPGIWYYTLLDADHITFILNPSRAGIHFDVLYNSIFERCRKQLKGKRRKIMEISNCNCVQVCICSNGDDTRFGA